jgi:hypothetical protein
MDLDTPANGYDSPVGTAVSTPPEAGRDSGDAAPRPSAPALFRERFEALLPIIQREWPEVARHTLEATRGSLDLVVDVIAPAASKASTLNPSRSFSLRDAPRVFPQTSWSTATV